MIGGFASAPSQTCRFGLPSLDELLGGGIPRGQTWLIEDQIGTDYDPLIMSFLANGLQSMDYSFLLSMEQGYEHYKRRLQSFGRNPDMEMSTGRLRFIDAFTGDFNAGWVPTESSAQFSSGTYGAQGYTGLGGVSAMGGLDAGGREGIEHIRDLTDPRELNEAIRRAMLHVKEGPTTAIRGACISLSSLVLSANNMKDIFTFIQNRRAQDSLRNSTTLLTLHADAHEPILLKGIEHQMDGVLRLSPMINPQNSEEVIQVIEVVNIRGKSELSGKRVGFRFVAGRITSI